MVVLEFHACQRYLLGTGPLQGQCVAGIVKCRANMANIGFAFCAARGSVMQKQVSFNGGNEAQSMLSTLLILLIEV